MDLSAKTELGEEDLERVQQTAEWHNSFKSEWWLQSIWGLNTRPVISSGFKRNWDLLSEMIESQMAARIDLLKAIDDKWNQISKITCLTKLICNNYYLKVSTEAAAWIDGSTK